MSLSAVSRIFDVCSLRAIGNSYVLCVFVRQRCEVSNVMLWTVRYIVIFICLLRYSAPNFWFLYCYPLRVHYFSLDALVILWVWRVIPVESYIKYGLVLRLVLRAYAAELSVGFGPLTSRVKDFFIGASV